MKLRMLIRRRILLTGALATGVITALVAPTAHSDPKTVQGTAANDVQSVGAGIDTYVYGYPLVAMEMTRRVTTNVVLGGEQRAPMGQFANMRTYPTAAFHDVVSPNADTLYSSAWLDLSKEPYVLSIPDMKGRYYLFPILDAWTNVFESPGTRTTGTRAQKYAITGPGWDGTLPPGVTRYTAPTNVVWIIGRIYSSGTPSDYAEVHRLQDQLSLVPLSAYGKPYTPPTGMVDPSIDMQTSVSAQVDRADAAAFFGIMAQALKENPPAQYDAQAVERMAKVGVFPGQDFDASKLPAPIGIALKAAPKLGQARVMLHTKDIGRHENGWLVPTEMGQYGTDYVQRASVAAFGLGANLLQDSAYAIAEKDADGNEFDGAHDYVVHFAAGELPPVKGFWSLTMYDPKRFFVPNALNRYSLGSRDKFAKNPDGSVDLYIQKGNPGGAKEANWLPAPPSGKFIPILRLYWPNETSPTILDDSWAPPPVRHTD